MGQKGEANALVLVPWIETNKRKWVPKASLKRWGLKGSQEGYIPLMFW